MLYISRRSDVSFGAFVPVGVRRSRRARGRGGAGLLVELRGVPRPRSANALTQQEELLHPVRPSDLLLLPPPSVDTEAPPPPEKS